MSNNNTNTKPGAMEVLFNGLVKENPTFVLMLGMCPTLGTTSSAFNGMSMGLATMAVLIVSNLIISLIKKLIPDWESVTYYISGPQAMYNFLDGEFAKMNIRKKSIRKEEFGESDDITKLAEYPKGNEDKTFKIKVLFGKDERVIDALATDSVVVSLEKAGIAPDSHCRSGACGFCRSLLLEGDVWQRPQSDGVRAADKDMGYFHPCSAYPMSDLTIEVCSRL